MSTQHMCDFLVVTIGESRVQMDTADDLASMLNRLGYPSYAFHGRYSWKSLFPSIISKLQPRCVIAVNLLRPHFGEVFKDVPAMATWLQDTTSALSRPGLAAHWNVHCPADMIFGYAAPAEALGFNTARVRTTPFFIDPEKFKPGKASGAQMFAAMSKGDVVSSFLKETRRKHAELFQCDMTIGLWIKLAERLKEFCSGGGRFGSFDKLSEFVKEGKDDISRAWPTVVSSPRLQVLGYWHVYERVYRQTVMRWALESGIGLTIAGEGWKSNPMFSYSSIGPRSRSELGAWYSSSKWSLHVNNHKGYHHRYIEVLLSGGVPLAHGDPVPRKPFDRETFVRDQDACLLELVSSLFSGKRTFDEARIGRLYDVLDRCVYFRNKEELAFHGREVSNAVEGGAGEASKGIIQKVSGHGEGEVDR